jgi:hypothetical protein
MRRPTAASSLFNVFKTGLAGVFALSILVSCGEYPESGVITTPPNGGITRVHVTSVDMVLPDSLKYGSPEDVSGNSMVPGGPVADVLAAPFSPAAAIAAGACGGSGAAPEYTQSRVAFVPEQAPNVAAIASDLKDDGLFPLSIGFNFTFAGNTYNSINVFSNGFLTFGAAPASAPANGGSIAAPSTPNNMIALAWADWSPQKVADGIRWETRGTAPNRKFILQFNNVPEFNNSGMLMSQVVLTEGKNDITIYTNQMSTNNSGHLITQGIENATGTYALYDTFLNTTLNRDLPRVKNFFKLQNDAIRFTPVSTKDEVAPTFDAVPVSLEHFNDPGLATAVVAVAPPGATDNCSAVTVTGVRSDGVLSLDAPYPVGVTTITWTAKDADGNVSTTTQTVTVIDNEAPVWAASAESVLQVNATSPSGASVSYDLHVRDNVGVTSLSCQPASGSVFPVGNTPVECTAADAAGNSAVKSFSVNVISAHEQIGFLIEQIDDLGLPNGSSQPVINQLRTAYDQTADGSAACKKVSDFLSMVQKKSSNLSADEVAYLTAEGSRILDVMGCPPPGRGMLSVPSFNRVPPQTVQPVLNKLK